MDFIVRRQGNVETGKTKVTVQDGNTTVFHSEILSKRNNGDGWHAILTYLHMEKPAEVEALVASMPQLLESAVVEDVLTYRSFLYAILRLLEPKRQHHTPLCRQLEQLLFSFKAECPVDRYVITLTSPLGELYRLAEISREKVDESPVRVSEAILAAAYLKEQELGLQPVRLFVENYDYYQKNVSEADDVLTLSVFTSFSKALVNLIQQGFGDLGSFASIVPDICAFIVKNEHEDAEEQKVYLEPILRSREDERKRNERLDDIIENIKQDIQNRRQTQNEEKRLMLVVGLISEHYLQLYDLDRSATFWDKVENKSWLLRFFLSLHKQPHFYLLIQLLSVSVLSAFAYNHWRAGTPFPLHLKQIDPHWLMMGWYIVLLVLLIATVWQIIRNRWFYSQLLLPRLLGATIVGLVPLLLDGLPWQIGVQSSLINWALLTLFTYVGSFVYIFIEVYNTIKFAQGRSIEDAFKVSFRIFLIALTEALFIVTVTSTLLFPIVGLAESQFGIYAELYIDGLSKASQWVPGLSNGWLSFGFYPALIILWTGIALFVGSFVQLLWQDRRITSSIQQV